MSIRSNLPPPPPPPLLPPPPPPREAAPPLPTPSQNVQPADQSLVSERGSASQTDVDVDDMVFSDEEEPQPNQRSPGKTVASRLAIAEGIFSRRSSVSPKPHTEAEAKKIAKRLAMIHGFGFSDNLELPEFKLTSARKQDILKTARWLDHHPEKARVIRSKGQTGQGEKFSFLFEPESVEGKFYLKVVNMLKSSTSVEPAETSDVVERTKNGTVKAEPSPDNGSSGDSSAIKPEALATPIEFDGAPYLHEAEVLAIDKKATAEASRGSPSSSSNQRPVRDEAEGVVLAADGAVAHVSSAEASKSLSTEDPGEYTDKKRAPPAPPAGWVVKWSGRRERWFWFNKSLQVSQWMPPFPFPALGPATARPERGNRKKQKKLGICPFCNEDETQSGCACL